MSCELRKSWRAEKTRFQFKTLKSTLLAKYNINRTSIVFYEILKSNETMLHQIEQLASTRRRKKLKHRTSYWLIGIWEILTFFKINLSKIPNNSIFSNSFIEHECTWKIKVPCFLECIFVRIPVNWQTNYGHWSSYVPTLGLMKLMHFW